jgi:hypothetical protein
MLATAIVAAATVFITISYLQTSVDHSLAYSKKLESFSAIEGKAIAPLQKENITDEDLLEELSSISKPRWQQAKTLIEETKAYELEGVRARERNLLAEYIELRIRETDLLIQVLKGDESSNEELGKVSDLIRKKLEEISKNSK